MQLALIKLIFYGLVVIIWAILIYAVATTLFLNSKIDRIKDKH
jgi:hypothetical protein